MVWIFAWKDNRTLLHFSVVNVVDLGFGEFRKCTEKGFEGLRNWKG